MTGLEKLIKIRDDMVNGTLPVPDTYVDTHGNYYPPFHAALTEVIEAQETGKPSPKCICCGVIGYDYPATKAYAPGHCYSSSGIAEFTRISGVCEWCFDRITQALNEDEQEDNA